MYDAKIIDTLYFYIIHISSDINSEACFCFSLVFTIFLDEFYEFLYVFNSNSYVYLSI